MLGLEMIMAAAIMNPHTIKAQEIAFPYDCKARPAPQINVKPSQSRIKYNFTQSKAQLNARNTDTISPYGPQHTTNVSGLMSGTIGLRSNVSFVTETYGQFGMGCVYLKAVNVTINIDPTIYIAREFPQGGCMHNAILAHEMKHVNEDQYVVNKYINEIGKAISDKIKIHGSVYGPMKVADMKTKQEIIQRELQNEVRYMNEVLNKERGQRQQAIDTLEEYESIGFQCKSRNKPRRR